MMTLCPVGLVITFGFVIEMVNRKAEGCEKEIRLYQVYSPALVLHMPVCYNLWIIAGPGGLHVLEKWPAKSDGRRAIAGFVGQTQWLGTILG